GVAPALPKRLPGLGASVDVVPAFPKRLPGLGASVDVVPALPKRPPGFGASVDVVPALPKRPPGFGASADVVPALPKRLDVVVVLGASVKGWAGVDVEASNNFVVLEGSVAAGAAAGPVMVSAEAGLIPKSV